MEKMIFLDLEDTIITSWGDPHICNLQKVKNFLAKHSATEIHIFSFAIVNDHYKEIFDDLMKEWLENVLKVKIASWPSREEIAKVILKFTKNHFDHWELITVWGKLKSFQDFCQAQFQDKECVLFDDVVPNTSLLFHDTNLSIRTVKC